MAMVINTVMDILITQSTIRNLGGKDCFKKIKMGVYLESHLNQSAVKVQFCSEKVPVFRSRLERDSNMIRTKG